MDPEEQSISEQPPQYPWLHTLADAVSKAGDWLEDETPKKSNVNQWILEHLNRPLINAQVEGLARPVQRMAEHAAYGDKNAWVSGSGETTQITPDAMVVAPMIAGGLTGFKKIAAEALSELGTTGSAMGKAGQRGIFTLSRDVDLNSKAEDMRRAGLSNEDIWKQLGIWKHDKATGGKWLKELDDSQAKFMLNKEIIADRPAAVKNQKIVSDAYVIRQMMNEGYSKGDIATWFNENENRQPNWQSHEYAKNHSDEELLKKLGEAQKEVGAPYSTTLNKALPHPELEALYPSLSTMGVETRSNEDMGGNMGLYYHGKPGKLSLNQSWMWNEPESRKTVLHEVSHAVARQEGREPGANIEHIMKVKNSGIDAQEKALRDLHSDGLIDKDDLDRHLAALPKKLTKEEAKNLYLTSVGEAEARAVERRADYSKEQRQLTYPLKDYRTPRGQLNTQQDLYDPNLEIK